MAVKREIQRHSLQTRITHDIVAISIIWLSISGLFVLIPGLGAMVPVEFTQFLRFSHRIVGAVLLITPIVSAILAPAGVKRLWRKYITAWTKEDVEFVLKFVPYMLGPKRVHMPDQDEVKSGQRIADGMLMISALLMIVSGMVLWLGTSIWRADPSLLVVMRFIHQLFFLLMLVFVIAHAYLGGGVFQPYRGTISLMFGNGRVKESDALYHWGFWAREELEEGKNVIEYEVPDSDDKPGEIKGSKRTA
ncbi:cytochrome b/b6 domain-containing protein [Eggerthellaceae bacterium zg-1084]|uniref:Cytochrome b/b6 domain-containing protein n=1 Tax=Berryella wangjianweii TaxID=2734634 RepID=A0A6M8J288_9ACTN|nr:cytochrome b/b6 domain-containing protein [Berryella wangjianweii]NPD30585.1 cytochrome b/b6 domain-containing protein [Berryella wangjianweii]NPD32198.1 cytochrome b/b6 domain-containing protein [Eggerthellaceae bacterium zg-997]QKF07241.1 cytochrome b/b6 domain-containing protein [Berryella wangjianweii]